MANEQTTGQALKTLSHINPDTLTELADSISVTELDYLDGVTAGTVTASKALVADANGNFGVGKMTQLHIGTSGSETQVTATGAELNYLDITTLGTGAASKAVVLDANGDYTWPAGQLTFQTAHSGLLHGAGASGANHALGATADNAMEYYFDSTHTTGDMRGLYLRLYFSGVGGSGEAARIFSTINNKTVATGGTVNGAHITLNMTGASAAVSGAANALRATFSTASTTTNPGGTLSVIQVDADIATETTLPTTHAFMAFRNIGTGAMTRLFEVPDVASGGLLAAHITDAMTHSLRIRSADGTLYYLQATTTVTNRTGGG